MTMIMICQYKHCIYSNHDGETYGKLDFNIQNAYGYVNRREKQKICSEKCSHIIKKYWHYINMLKIM